MSYIKSHVVAIGLLILVIIGACLLYLSSQANKMSDRKSAPETALTDTGAPAVTIEKDGIQFEIASTTAEAALGLGDRAVIPDNYGMLFVFPQDEMPGFWMKDMLTSIDMIWITNAGTIASITPSVSPSTYPTPFYPPVPIRYVLETRAGFAAEKHWSVGTTVSLPSPY